MRFDAISTPEKRTGLAFSISHRLVPYIVLASFIPVLIIFSLLAGLAVWNNVATGWDVPVYLQYGEAHSPRSQFTLPSLVPNQPYGLSLCLEVPAVPMSYELGNFMASLTLLSSSTNKPLVKFTRPAIVLPPKKSRIPFSSTPTTTKIHIDLADNYKPSTSALVALVEIGRVDNWRSLGAGHARELSVVSAKLVAIVQHRGIWGLGARFPLAFAFCASAAFFGVSFSVLAACLLPAMIRSLLREQKKQVPKEETSQTTEPPARRASPPPSYAQVKEEYSSDDGRSPRRPSRRRSSSLSSKTSPLLTPAQPSTSIRPLRQRRSRILDSDSD